MKLIKEITDKDIIGKKGLSSKSPRRTARAFLFNKSGLIAVVYVEKHTYYSIPGGGIEDGEDLITAVKREIMEEVGCECEIIGELGYVYENRAHCDYTTISYYYVAEVKNEVKSIHLTQSEIDNGISVSWYHLEDAIRLIGSPCHEVVQKKFIQCRDMAALEELNQFLALTKRKNQYYKE